ncbi:unnamed protein product [Brugia timori]|uniref:Ovule protein n=1 Tax=Brugia timori TaxID=42155 RepID=A0A0R3QLX9_9BILA|nr:unnamed protein product [Brugia timori]
MVTHPYYQVHFVKFVMFLCYVTLSKGIFFLCFFFVVLSRKFSLISLMMTYLYVAFYSQLLLAA